MSRVNPDYIKCLISEMQNMTSRMDEIIERDWSKFLNYINEHKQKEVDNEKKNKSHENIYLLMKERLGKYMNEGVEQDLREFLNFVSEQNMKEKSVRHKLLVKSVLYPFSRYEIGPTNLLWIDLS